MVSYDGSLYVAQIDRVMKFSNADSWYRKGARAADKMIIGPDILPNRTWYVHTLRDIDQSINYSK
jgi:hypothetical protein